MFKTSSRLPENARVEICAALNQRLADGIDLYTHLKVAHWNVKGPLFSSLHALFETVAGSVNESNDEIAERAVTLGGRAYGTARRVAKTTKLTEYPEETARDLEHVRAVVERVEAHLEGLRDAKRGAGAHGDDETVDLLTGIIEDLEKHGWMLRATLEG